MDIGDLLGDLLLLLLAAVAIYYIMKEEEESPVNNNSNSASAEGQGTGSGPEVDPEEQPIVQPEILPVIDIDGKELNPGDEIQSNNLLPQGATVAENGGIQYTGDQLSAAIDVLKDRINKGEVQTVTNTTADKCSSPPCPPAHCTIVNSVMEKTKKDPKWGASFKDFTGPYKCSNLDGTGTIDCQKQTSTFCTAQGLANIQSPLCIDNKGTTNPAVLCYCPPLQCRPKFCNGTQKLSKPKWGCMSITNEAGCKGDSQCEWA